MEFPIITSVTIDVTESCNFNCEYCFTYSDHPARHLKLEDGKKYIQWLFDQVGDNKIHVPLSISWWGGEPLIRFDLIKELTLYAEELSKKYNIEVTFNGTTNGYLFTHEMFMFFKEHKTHWLFTIDGNSTCHNFYRKTKGDNETHSKVVENFKLARELGLNVSVRGSIAPAVIGEYFNSIKFFNEDLAISDMIISPVTEYEWDEEALSELETQINLVHQYLKNTVIEKKQILHILQFNEILKKLAQKQKDLKHMAPCGAGRHYICITIDGYIFPCHRFNKHGISSEEREKSPVVIGKIRDGKLIHLNSEFRESIMNFHDHIKDPCLSCDLYESYLCDGACIALNYDKTGSIHVADENNCKFSKTRTNLIKEFYKELEGEDLIRWFTEEEIQRKTHPTQQGCICYNGCYLQDTQWEIIHTDRNSPATCHCYQMEFSGNPNPEAFVTKYEFNSPVTKVGKLIDNLPDCDIKDILLEKMKKINPNP